MSASENFGNYFKNEIRSSGAKLHAQGKVSIQNSTDNEIHAYVRGTPLSKVRFWTRAVGNPSFFAQCSCPMSGKSQFCKHVWATLLCAEQKASSFLHGKESITKPSDFEGDGAAASAASIVIEKRKAVAKERAAEYRKSQYERQKLHAKTFKKGRTIGGLPSQPSWPPEVVDALVYFSLNGFSMLQGPSEAELGEAKLKLSRVFHPDKGGTNEEAVELNRNCELLLRFLKN